MKYIIAFIIFGCCIAKASSSAPAAETAHAKFIRTSEARIGRDIIDSEFMFQLYRTLKDVRYPIEHDALLGKVRELTEVSGWHVSSSRKVKKLFYDLPLFGAGPERYKVMLVIASGEKPSEMIVSSANIVAVVKHGYFIKEDIE